MSAWVLKHPFSSVSFLFVVVFLLLYLIAKVKGDEKAAARWAFWESMSVLFQIIEIFMDLLD